MFAAVDAASYPLFYQSDRLAEQKKFDRAVT